MALGTQPFTPLECASVLKARTTATQRSRATVQEEYRKQRHATKRCLPRLLRSETADMSKRKVNTPDTLTPGPTASTASITVSRKKRVRNVKSVGELPESLFKKQEGVGGRIPGLEKRHRKNQGGVRPRRNPGASAAPSSVASVATVTAQAGGLLDAAVEKFCADVGFDNHVDPESDHETEPTRDTAPSGADLDLTDSDDYSSGSEWDDEIEYEAYSEAVRSNVACFVPVCGNIFVVQGWNAPKFHTTTSFYHLRFQTMGNGDLSVACTCPIAAHEDCFHIRYFRQYDIEEKAKGDTDVNAALFAQKFVAGIGLDSRFSVQSKSMVELRGRAIVRHQGSSRDTGVWRCSKDRGASSCYHITQAMALLPERFGDKVAGMARLNGAIDLLGSSNVRAEVRGPGQTISYLPIHPPHWAKLKTDPVLYTPLPEFRVPPPNTIFKLERRNDKGEGGSTCADEDRTAFDPTRPIETKECKFYSILNVYQVNIQVQTCPKCPRERKRYIGPDLRAHGIFNYNNRVLVSHELLDEYTSAYTSSEKPVWSYVQDVDRRYRREQGKTFMGPDLFRAVWFSYVHLQRFADDMSCETCGPTPQTVIFDRISLGYGQKHVKDSLKPPTLVSEHSMIRQGLDYTRQQQVLPDAMLRRRLRSALDGPDFDLLMEDLEERLGVVSLSPLRHTITSTTRAPGGGTLSTPSDPLSTPSITRSLIDYAIDSLGSPSTPSPVTPTKNGSPISGSGYPSPIKQPSFPSQPSFTFGISASGFPLPPTSVGSATASADNPFLERSPSDATTVVTAAPEPNILPQSNTSGPGPKPPSPTKEPSQGKRGLSDDEWKSRQKSLVKDHLELVEWVYQELRKQGGAACPELADLFNRFFGQVAFTTKGRHTKSVRAVWKNLFTQIAAEESVIQMVNFTSLQDLRGYLRNPTAENSSLLVSIPAFHKALTSKECDVPALNSVMCWIELKARSVLNTLIKKASPPIPLASPETLPKEDDWRKTGSYYSMPVIRHRPAYPKLDDGEKKKSKKSGPRGDRCGKYYSEYKERRLTGGIMVCWCQHSVCYGFHTIPESEGRNDVFSALVTRWREAPERVIYDFACALGPYCMTREPQFFGKTYFMIDHFHAEGHTKCSPAAFLSEYENTNPHLSSINSSAAECGNGVLRKIRKSVSYMSQERAIVYTKVFLSIWNRTRALQNRRKRKKRLGGHGKK